MVEVVETPEAKLKRHEDALVACMAEITKLREENARLRSEKSDALSVCQEVYSDPNAPAALRLKAAGLALPHEVPRLEPVPPPIELTAEPYVPLAELVTIRRARADKALLEPPFSDLPKVFPLRGNGGGSDDDDGQN
jgi:hypothetical protein